MWTTYLSSSHTTTQFLSCTKYMQQNTHQIDLPSGSIKVPRIQVIKVHNENINVSNIKLSIYPLLVKIYCLSVIIKSRTQPWPPRVNGWRHVWSLDTLSCTYREISSYGMGDTLNSWGMVERKWHTSPGRTWQRRPGDSHRRMTAVYAGDIKRGRGSWWNFPQQMGQSSENRNWGMPYCLYA